MRNVAARLALLGALWLLAASAWAAPRIGVATMAPGEVFFERFGHNAIVVVDPASGDAISYNFGFFDPGEADFVGNFARGHMMYYLVALPFEQDLVHYRDTGRGVSLQWLDLTPEQARARSGSKALVGRAIVRSPKVFLFDEPLSNLDAALRGQTRVEIAKLHRDLGATTIYVTHDQVEAMTLADKIVLLNTGERIAKHGSIAQVGSPMTLYHRPASLFVAEFIGSPKMNILGAQLSAVGASSSEAQVAGAHFHAAVDTQALRSGAAISVGVRPEDMRVAQGPGANVLSGQVAHIEKLGDASLLYVTVNAQTPLLTLKVEGTTTQAVQASRTAFLLPARNVRSRAPRSG